MSKHPDSQLPLQKLIQDVLDYTSMSIPKFSDECQFKGSTRIYAVFNEDRALGVDSYSNMLKRFPELNGDRFLRKSGPLLLADLCNKNTTLSIPQSDIIQSSNVLSNNEDYYKAIIQGKDNEIMRQEKEIEFLRVLLTK